MGGVEVALKNVAKSFGSANIFSDVTLTLPAGEISALLGPSGTGKSVLLKSIIGLLKPEKGSIFIHDTDLVRCSEQKLYEIRKLFGVLFQDGALFGSMNLFDNVAFPLREHTKTSESKINDIVMEKLDLVGLGGAEDKLPGEISGGMKKRAGLARALVLDPEIILVDEPDSGLDPVRTAYLNQLLVDINTQLDATILIVTHHLGTARSMPDNIGMLFRRNLVMFGPREVLLTSEEPVVQQFLQGRRVGPIGMSEEKDSAQMEAEMEELKRQGGSAESEESFIDPQVDPSEGEGERAAVQRRKDRVMQVLHTLPEKAQTAILESLTDEDQERYGISRDQDRTELIQITRENPPEDADPFGHDSMAEDRTESSGEGEGSGDPDQDREARNAPPDPPDTDEPLVGVPVDEDAGGTVVLPQGGEHTKSEEQKADEAGVDDSSGSDETSSEDEPSDEEPAGGESSDEGSAQGSEDPSVEDESSHDESSDDQASRDQVSRDQASRDQTSDGRSTDQSAGDSSSDGDTTSIPQQGAADSDGSQDGEPREDGSEQHTDQIAATSDGAPAGRDGSRSRRGRHAAPEDSAPTDQNGSPAGLGLVAMARKPDREMATRSSGRSDERGGWAAPATDGSADQETTEQLDGVSTPSRSGNDGGSAQHRSTDSTRGLGVLRRLFQRGDS